MDTNYAYLHNNTQLNSRRRTADSFSDCGFSDERPREGKASELPRSMLVDGNSSIVVINAATRFSRVGGRCSIELTFPELPVAATSPACGLDIHLETTADNFWIAKYSAPNLSGAPDSWKRFSETYLDDVVDMLGAHLAYDENEDLVLVAPSRGARSWALSITRTKIDQWKGVLVEKDRPAAIDMTYALMQIPDDERSEHLSELYEQLQWWLCGLDGPDIPAERVLTIKAYPTELWFLRFPVGLLCELNYPGLEAYQNVEWIVTDRHFMENSRIRQRIQSELSDAASILAHAVVIINTYAEHGHDARYREGTELIQEVLSCFQDVQLGEQNLSLRWRLNPTCREIETLLSDPQTHYFFADFEASRGEWQLGEELCESEVIDRPRACFFRIDGGRCRMPHIRLMRVFHCNSVFDPSRMFVDGREPGDEHSIVRKLLEAGAQRVEGGMTEESYFDYLCSLFQLFCDPGRLGFLLRMKCLELDIDFESLVARVNSFLTASGWPRPGGACEMEG